MADRRTKAEALTPVRLGARTIAPPPTISPEAQAYLSTMAANPRPPRPAVDDLDAWRAAITAGEAMWDPVVDDMLARSSSVVETRVMGGAKVHVGAPDGMDAAARTRAYLYIHGGAFVFGGGRYPMGFAATNADALGCTVVSVDYRMPPDHPFPAAPEDCLAVYEALIKTYAPAKVAIGGSSAGGNLAAATALMIRDRGLPMPGALVLLTPEVDLTEAGDSFRTNELLDVVLQRGLPDCNALYAGGADLTDPYLSPLFADFAKGFAPTLIQTGTRDLFLSNSALMHRKLRDAGIEAELHVWEGMPHGGFGGTAPEDAEIFAETRRFIEKHC